MLVLLVAGAVEFVLLRIVNRVAGHLPGGAQALVGGNLVLAGTAAYNLAYLAGALALAICAWLLWRRDAVLALLLAAWVPALAAAQILDASSAPGIVFADLVAVAVLVLLATRSLRAPVVPPATLASPRLRRALGYGARAFPLAVAATFLSALYLHVGDALAPAGLGWPARVEVFAVAEAWGVAAALLAPLAVGLRRDWATIATASAAALVVGVWAVVRPAILPLVAFWSLGFQMTLPWPLYIAGVAAMAYALGTAFRARRETGLLFAGLLLVVLAGRMLADLYLVQMAVVGFLFLTTPRPLAASVATTSPAGRSSLA